MRIFSLVFLMFPSYASAHPLIKCIVIAAECAESPRVILLDNPTEQSRRTASYLAPMGCPSSTDVVKDQHPGIRYSTSFPRALQLAVWTVMSQYSELSLNC